METNILNEIYDAYKSKVEEASSMWKSEYCCSQEEEDNRDKEDREELEWFIKLLQSIDNNFRRMNDAE